MTLRIAMTGATGFVGRHVLEKLKSSGLAVRVLARHQASVPQNPLIEIVQGALDDAAALAELCSGADVVLHVAGAIRGLTQADFDHVNVDGTNALLAASRSAGVKRFVHVSSLAAREPKLSDYARSKHAAEICVTGIGSPMATLILRAAAVYGEGDMATLPLISALMSRMAIVPGTKSARFSLIHVADFAATCAAAVMSDDTGMREIDDGSGAYRWADLVAVTRRHYGRPRHVIFIPKFLALGVGAIAGALAKATKKPGMITVGKMRELYHPDWSAAGPGWPRKNPVLLADGLLRTIEWYMAQGLLPRLPLAVTSAPRIQTDND